MDFSYKFDIGIVEYRNIIKVIKDTYGYDFSDYALTSLKRRFEKVILEHNLKQSDNLIEKILKDAVFFDKFLQEVAIEGTEMFRDPSLWRYLRDEILPMIINEENLAKIWFPFCISGDELYTLAIVLKESDLLDKIEIIASCINNQVIEQVQKGVFRPYKIDVSIDNYSHFQGNSHLNDYYKIAGDQVIRDTSLIKNANFIKQNINFDNSPKEVKLVIFRNQLIYYNQNLHDRVLKIIHQSLMTGGYLAIGFKEQIGMINSNNFKIVNVAENVYKKV
jgi:chemotaxis protein methyltransferase CheR